MSEQLYRWVNGNKKELHPEIDNSDLPITYTVRFNGDDPHTGWVSSKQMTAAQIRDCDYSDYWEWLEPYTPSLNAGSLEEAAKKYSSDYIKEEYGDVVAMTVVEAKVVGELCFLAGAGYSKGGEEKGLTKEEIAQICEMADNDYAAQESITFLEWVGKEGWKWSELNSRWFKLGSDDYLNETQLHEKFKERDVTEEHKSDREPEAIKDQVQLWKGIIKDFSEIIKLGDLADDNVKELFSKYHITRKDQYKKDPFGKGITDYL